MKKYLIKIALFFVAVAVIDVLFGFACQYMNSHSKGGGVKSRYYVCKESNEDVLIFGSSRAKHHYVPDIIEDSLGMSCYNTGEDGNGIILCYGFLKMITERYTPKLIIYDLSSFDMYVDDNMKYVNLLKPYYDEPGIDSIFSEINPRSIIMMYSNMYRFNTTCLQVFGNYFHPISNYPKGYSPLNKRMGYEPEVLKQESKTVDTLKIRYFKAFIQLARKKGICMVCCISPFFNVNIDNDYYDSIKDLLKQYDIPLLIYISDPSITSDLTNFCDRSHLNDKGSRIYTRMVVYEVKKLLVE